MAKLKVSDYRKKEGSKLRDDYLAKEKEFAQKRLDFSLGKQKDVSIFRKLKKEIAKIKTVLKEKEVLNER